MTARSRRLPNLSGAIVKSWAGDRALPGRMGTLDRRDTIRDATVTHHRTLSWGVKSKPISSYGHARLKGHNEGIPTSRQCRILGINIPVIPNKVPAEYLRPHIRSTRKLRVKFKRDTSNGLERASEAEQVQSVSIVHRRIVGSS